MLAVVFCCALFLWFTSFVQPPISISNGVSRPLAWLACGRAMNCPHALAVQGCWPAHLVHNTPWLGMPTRDSDLISACDPDHMAIRPMIYNDTAQAGRSHQAGHPKNDCPSAMAHCPFDERRDVSKIWERHHEPT